MKPALLVTGAGGVIGQALVRRLAQDEVWNGCRWILTARQTINLQALEEALKGSGLDVSLMALDMLDEAGCRAFLSALPGLGPFKGLALVAGINHDDLISRLDEKGWDRVWQVNVGFHAKLLRQAAFTPDGRALLVSSQVGMRGAAGQTAYGAAKGALLDLMRSLPLSLRVNTLLPPLVDSPLLDNLAPESRERLFAARLLADPDPARSCADAGAFLLSDASGYIQRQVWNADSRVSVLGLDE